MTKVTAGQQTEPEPSKTRYFVEQTTEFIVVLGILALYGVQWAWAKYKGRDSPQLIG